MGPMNMQQPQMSQVLEVPWRGLNGNPWNAKLNPQMLTGQYRDLRTVKPPGQRGKYAEAVDCYVIYDRDFVVEKIWHLVVEPLQLNSLDELHQLMDEVWGLTCTN